MNAQLCASGVVARTPHRAFRLRRALDMRSFADPPPPRARACSCRGCWCVARPTAGALLHALLAFLSALLASLAATTLPWLDPTSRALPGLRYATRLDGAASDDFCLRGLEDGRDTRCHRRTGHRHLPRPSVAQGQRHHSLVARHPSDRRPQTPTEGRPRGSKIRCERSRYKDRSSGPPPGADPQIEGLSASSLPRSCNH